MNICVVGIGYVGLANALLLSKKHNVIMLDIDIKKVNQINTRISPIKDELIEQYLQDPNIKITATLDTNLAFKNADFIIIATPTNYDEKTHYFDTQSIEKVMQNIMIYNTNAIIIIKSTIPIGYTEFLSQKFQTSKLIFCPEFLREGKALYDSLYPNRIIIANSSENAHKVAKLFKNSILNSNAQILFMNFQEAESVKLFSNTYLAMRISFFNELDSFARTHGLNAKDIILGICADPRIGQYYNNPSFGYGGYCLPKDSKQLLANFKETPNALIKAIVDANEVRKKFIVSQILSSEAETIGFYRLIMKHNSDNFRNSVMLDLIKEIKKHKQIYIYEPLIKDQFMDLRIENDFDKFVAHSKLIVANRLDENLSMYADKIFTSDIFNTDI